MQTGTTKMRFVTGVSFLVLLVVTLVFLKQNYTYICECPLSLKQVTDLIERCPTEKRTLQPVAQILKQKEAERNKLRGSETWKDYTGEEKNLEIIDVDVPDQEEETVRERITNLKASHKLINLKIPELEKLNKEKVAQTDKKLIKVIRDYWVYNPTKLQYNLADMERKDFSRGQSAIVDSILNQKENGFFVECGALDGEGRSNSLFFERERSWNGLLIEAGLVNFNQLLKRHRKSFLINACLSTKPFPSVMYFSRQMNIGRIKNKQADTMKKGADRAKSRDTPTQCFPFYSMLAAINRTEIDYFSLDIEGDELPALETIPWNLVNIKVIGVEFSHGDKAKLRKFVENKGYEHVAEITRPSDGSAMDFIFVKKGIKWPS